MKAVRFLETRTVDFGDGPITYEAGSVHTLRDDKAQRWVTRAAAVYVAQEAVPVEAPAEVQPEVEPEVKPDPAAEPAQRPRKSKP